MRLCCLLAMLLLPWAAKADDILDRANLTGDWGGARGRLEAAGVQLGADEILEALGNPRGGQRQGAVAEGRFEVFANIDLQTALGWQGALFHANAYQIHGQGLTAHDLGNLVTVSNIESRPATRLFGLWLQQALAGDAVSVRLGQIAADDEFFVSQYAPLFLNSTFGWPSILGINLPGGGPAYPVARPGVRVRAALSPRLTLSAAVFSGDPSADDTGLNLRFHGGVFAVTELSYAADIFGLPGTIKLGGWEHTGRVADQRFDTRGFSLASGGAAALHRGDYGGYAILDQLLWRNSGTSESGLGGFLRAGVAPSDRNQIAFHMDGGLTYAGAFGRDNDTIGIAMSLEQVSDAQHGLTGDFRALTGIAAPYPDLESALEVSWQMQLATCWILQPDLQWIIHPGGRLLDTAHPLAVNPNALVLGLRTAIAL